MLKQREGRDWSRGQSLPLFWLSLCDHFLTSWFFNLRQYDMTLQNATPQITWHHRQSIGHLICSCKESRFLTTFVRNPGLRIRWADAWPIDHGTGGSLQISASANQRMSCLSVTFCHSRLHENNGVMIHLFLRRYDSRPSVLAAA